MVLIEIVRNIIRPITLSVRLAANIVAGHLLITLVTSRLPGSRASILLTILIPLIALFVLETAVALIQSYVFITLSSLYIGESNRIITL
jgi:F-type H+-transporting ATPase subunit a